MASGSRAGGPFPRGQLVTVFGGTGFVGRHIVRELARRGYRVRAAVRRPDLAGHLQPMGGVGQIHAVQANLRFPDSVARAVIDADAVINCVGILMPTGAQTFEAVQAKGAAAVGKAAAQAGITNVVHISAIGADAQSPSHYARTKAEGERAILNAVADAVVLRPSIVFGPEDEFFNRFAALARMSPVLPLIGGGKTRFQPVYVGDVAQAAVNSIEGIAEPGTIYELGGPEVLTFRQLLERTQHYAGRDRALLPLPFWFGKVIAALTWPLPNALRPITVDQVRLLKSDTVVSDAALRDNLTLERLGVTEPTAIAAVVPAYLERFNPRGQFAHYRT